MANEQKKLRPAIQKKAEQVEKLTAWMKKSDSICIVDIRQLPDRLLQAAKKKLRGKADFVVMKNSVIKRAMEASNMAALGEKITTPTALVFTKMTPYSLFRFFKDNKSKVGAKPGQIAPFDIIVPEGETDLPPGPALTELKNAGIAAQIKGGKIIIAKPSVVAKSGMKITGEVCKALQKLNIKPFEAGLNMIYAYDGTHIYSSSALDFDPVQLRMDLLMATSQAMNVSINSSFPTQQNAEIILANAVSQARNLAINGSVPSTVSIEALLARAVGIGEALSSKAGSPEAKTVN